MGKLFQLLATSFMRKVGRSTILDSEAAAINAGWQAVERNGLRGVQRATAVVGESAGSVANFFRAVPGKIWGHKAASTAIGFGGGGAYEANRWWDGVKESWLGRLILGNPDKGTPGAMPWLLGAAAIGGLFLMFKDKMFGKSEGEEVVSEASPAPVQTLSAAEQLMQPQMAMPMTVGNTVTAAYPAAVGSTYASGRPLHERSAIAGANGNNPERAENSALQVTQTPPPAANWQAKVGGQKQPVTAAPAPQESHLAAEQVRAEQAAVQQNSVV